MLTFYESTYHTHRKSEVCRTPTSTEQKFVGLTGPMGRCRSLRDTARSLRLGHRSPHRLLSVAFECDIQAVVALVSFRPHQLSFVAEYQGSNQQIHRVIIRCVSKTMAGGKRICDAPGDAYVC